MAICEICGFDGHTAGDDCSVCGGSGQAPMEDDSERTLVRDVVEAPTLVAASGSEGGRASGALFRDRYRIERPLGRGGMGTVYRAFDTRGDRAVALKIMHTATRIEDVSFSRFQREVVILRRLNHPLIPQISDAGLEDDRMYLVTELIEGESLRDTIARRAPMDPAEIARIGAFIAAGIEVAHQHGVIHRDIKPHNVMLTPEGDVRLLDFGIARDVSRGARSITDTGMMVGTPEYMSPEQFRGDKVDARTDIYSLGVLVFQMATGKLPFTGDTPISIGMKHVSDPPVPPRVITPEVPVWLNRVILKCLEKNREERYATAGELATDLGSGAQQRRHVKRLRNGDFLIEEDGDQSWALVLSSRVEKDWSEGTAMLMKGTYYRLELREIDESLPGPWVYRFTDWSEGEVIRKFVEYDPDQPLKKKQPSQSFLKKWFPRG